MRKYIIYILLTLTALWQSLPAQEVRVIPSLEKSDILIGEQTILNVRIVHSRSQQAKLILPGDTLVTGVGIVKYELSDSTNVNDMIKESIYSVIITSFDSAMYSLRNINALVGDSLYSATEAPDLFVSTVPVDLGQPDKYNDIKGVWKPAFVFMDYFLPIALSLLAVLIVLLIILERKHLLKRRALTPETLTKSVVQKDPYSEAIEAIESLKSRNLWENNMVKEYYTELTYILRRYIFRVHGLHTAEMTSSEILQAFRTSVDKGQMYQELQRILSMADLAKFAKYTPPSHDNISVLNAAEAFVREYKPIESEVDSIDDK